MTKDKFICRLCPRECGAERYPEYGFGYCKAGSLAGVSRFGPHMWEEPCISGANGSGTVFFRGCQLRCVYCQNHVISFGYDASQPLFDAKGLRSIYQELINQGVHNINLVTPTHFANVIAESLNEPLPVPVVWNTGGYEKAETIEMLQNKVQIYLTDFKYGSAECGGKYSNAPDYFKTALAAIKKMFEQTGPYVIGSDGIMKSGVIIRHLVLPGELENTFDVLDAVRENFNPDQILFSLMCQYTPQDGMPERFKNLTSRVSETEYSRAAEYMKTLGILNGFLQSPESAVSDYTPDFSVDKQ
ncbi:MAG: radical SAM protein [Firmicutes bacterium]|nr:radical SAM protein [Bacillota bacterium]